MSFPDPDVDLAALARLLTEVPSALREGFVVGRTACRDAIVDHLRCSEEEGEQLVETMIARGFLRFDAGTDSAPTWEVVPLPP